MSIIPTLIYFGLLVLFIIGAFLFSAPDFSLSDKPAITPSEIEAGKANLFVSLDNSSAPSLSYFQLGAKVENFETLVDTFETYYLDGEGDTVSFRYGLTSNEFYGDNITAFSSLNHYADAHSSVKFNLKATFNKNNEVISVSTLHETRNEDLCNKLINDTTDIIKEKYGVTFKKESFAYSLYKLNASPANSIKKSFSVIDKNTRFELYQDCDRNRNPTFLLALYTIDDKHNGKVDETTSTLISSTLFPLKNK